jgi:hypothetical protein
MNRLGAYLWNAGSDGLEPLPFLTEDEEPRWVEPQDLLPARLLALERLLGEIKGEIGAVHSRLDRLDRALQRIKGP